MRLPRRFCHGSYIKLRKNKHEYRRKINFFAQKSEITPNFQPVFHQTWFIARFAYVVHETREKITSYRGF